MTDFSFDDVPSRDPLPPEFEGPGISDDLEKIKTASLVDELFAVVGFIILDSTFAKPGEEQKYAMIEIKMPTGEGFVCATSSANVLRTLRKRNELGHIPFRAVLRSVPSKKNPTNTYYVLEDPQ